MTSEKLEHYAGILDDVAAQASKTGAPGRRCRARSRQDEEGRVHGASDWKSL